jgi:hypothetical protein
MAMTMKMPTPMSHTVPRKDWEVAKYNWLSILLRFFFFIFIWNICHQQFVISGRGLQQSNYFLVASETVVVVSPNPMLPAIELLKYLKSFLGAAEEEVSKMPNLIIGLDFFIPPLDKPFVHGFYPLRWIHPPCSRHRPVAVVNDVLMPEVGIRCEPSSGHFPITSEFLPSRRDIGYHHEQS